MAERATKPDDNLSVPDRIRQTGVRLQFLLRFVDNLPSAPEYGRESRANDLVRTWQESNAVRDAMFDLSEYFAAGYLELCRSAQLVRTPAYWGWRAKNLTPPSYHAAAADWCQKKVNGLLRILEPKMSFHENEAQVIRAAARWDFCDNELEEWAKDINEEKLNAIPLLGMERIQALLVWEQIPATSFTDEDRKVLDDAVENVRARSLGYKCKRCGKPAIVTSAGGKNAVKRYLRCRDRSCGWRGAAAKKAL
jgi:DNA-directed RNA polymerase subunit RPC12/RpoP